MCQAWFKCDSTTNKVIIDATKDVWEDFTENYAILIELFFLEGRRETLTSVSCAGVVKNSPYMNVSDGINLPQEVYVEDDSFVDVSGRTYMKEYQGVVTRAKTKQLKSHKDQIEQEKFPGLNFDVNFDVQDFMGIKF
ncbi:hypothetical protein M9H77_34757 [Catharanthus roseus]|uniref:Uncharacterized protein n=1 Tax=Catharanthus roseus TaxID=4058 RepID=A0ACB9ZRA9_CATRO|nr:hypothetical protein M9H77_34757 [Catharanthus roseus]